MSIDFRQNSTLHDYLLKQKKVCFEVSITANATPASKVLASDIPGVAILRCEGQTATADAIDNLTGIVTAPVDATGIFAILFDDAVAQKFLKATVTPSAGTVAVTKGLTSSGRMYLNIDSNQDISSTNLTLLVELEYKKA